MVTHGAKQAIMSMIVKIMESHCIQRISEDTYQCIFEEVELV
jgi:hypothetical protein